MKRLIFLLPLLFHSIAQAQLPQIRITGVFPAGAQQGTTIDVTVSAGTDLDEATELVFSHPALKAVQKTDGNGNPVTNQFTVSVDGGISPGLYDVRLRGLFGISNPRIFRIDTIPEVQETEPNNVNEQAQEMALNTIVNARSNGAADVDTFKVAAKAGQTIVFRSESAALDSLMQPVLELFDAGQKRVAHSRRRREKEAAIVYTSPTDQTLILTVHDTVYAGSNDYGYRLSIDDRQLIDFAVPQIVQTDVDSNVTLFGRHIPGGQATGKSLDGVPLLSKDINVRIGAEPLIVGTDSSAASVETAMYALDGNLISFALRSEPIVAVAETEATETPQVITVPAEIAASFEKEMDEDSFRFEAKKGEQWQIDVLAHRVGSNADPMLIVEQVTKAADGVESVKRIAREDEGKVNPGGANLPTLTSDPAFLLTSPEDGTYQVRLKDRFAASRGAANLTYSVSIRNPVPDFRVVVFDSFPSADGKAPADTGSVSIRKGGTYELPVYVYRIAGHNDDIQLRIEGLPDGVTCSPANIGPGKSNTLLVFTAGGEVGEVSFPVRIIGTVINGEVKSERVAKIATLVHAGANGLPRTARVSSSLLVSVMKDEEPFHILPAVLTADVSQDQQLLIPLKLTRRAGFDNKVDIAFVGQPGNVDVPNIAIEKGVDAGVVRCFFKENAATGPATLLMYVTGQVAYRRNPWQVDRAKLLVDEAVKQLETTKLSLDAAKAAAEAGEKKVAEAVAMVTTYETEQKVQLEAQTKATEDLKLAVAEKTVATKQLLALQATLTAAATNNNPAGDDFDAALKAVQEATAAVTEATKPVTALTLKLKELELQLGEKQKLVAEKSKQVADAKTEMAEQQKLVEKAKAEMAAAETNTKAREAEKKAADDAVKKAEEASKPQNKNYRTVAVPVSLNVHPTAGKIAAAVPDGGAIKKGAAVEVKLTLTRKNEFAGPVKVSLVLPEGITAVTSSTAEIAADQTEAMLTLTAAADAAAADIANAVIRATADFNGRQAHFDAPIALKVTE